MTSQEIKVAGNRIAVIIGKGGSTRRMLERTTSTTITIDSEEGGVHVESEDPVAVVQTTQIIKAIGRGFSPERALKLLEDEDMILEIIDLSDVCSTQKQFDRLRGRIIGRGGKAREQIEDMTGTVISVYGKTVAIIGDLEQIRTTRTGIQMIIDGMPHTSVFSYLDRKKKEAKQDILGYYY